MMMMITLNCSNDFDQNHCFLHDAVAYLQTVPLGSSVQVDTQEASRMDGTCWYHLYLCPSNRTCSGQHSTICSWSNSHEITPPNNLDLDEFGNANNNCTPQWISSAITFVTRVSRLPPSQVGF